VTVIDQPASRVQADRVQPAALAADAADSEPELSSTHPARPDALAGLSRAGAQPSSPEKPSRGVDWSRDRQTVFDDDMSRHFPDWQGSWCPLVLSFDGRPVTFAAADADARFDAGGATACDTFDWPEPDTPWLVRDLDGNGTIDGGHELLGAGTRMLDGTFASNGFAALAALDDDGDGWITPTDAAWSSLAVWVDHNRNRKTDPGELQSLDDLGVKALAVDYSIDRACDERGNCMSERASFVWMGDAGTVQAGQIIDVHLGCRRSSSLR
jgi:hypothetical protein